jgi:phosphatidylserine/phosphatidylglycerophosphate/cardiolipin synthase-like enzyme
VQAYSFTSISIAKALVDAERRGVDVRVIMDRSNAREKYSAATFLRNMGIVPLIDFEHAIAHNKILIIDAHLVVTGSFNFTKAAEERNAENVVFINDAAVSAAYTRNWQDHAAHSRTFAQLGSQMTAPTSKVDSTVRPQDEKAIGSLIGNRRSKIYQWPGCPQYGAVSQQNRVPFATREDAERLGYRAAKNCP